MASAGSAPVPNSQGLDQDALQNQTARAVEATQSALATRKEDYAANIAQVGLKRFFKCLLRLVVKNQDKPRTVRLRKQQWVAVDPRPWNVDMDVEINTGLGTGSRDRDLQTLNGVATKQEQVVLRLGPSNPLLGLDKLFVTYRKMAEAAGLRNAEAYFPEIDPQQLAQFAQSMQQPDPKAIERSSGCRSSSKKRSPITISSKRSLQRSCRTIASDTPWSFRLSAKSRRWNSSWKSERRITSSRCASARWSSRPGSPRRPTFLLRKTMPARPTRTLRGRNDPGIADEHDFAQRRPGGDAVAITDPRRIAGLLGLPGLQQQLPQQRAVPVMQPQQTSVQPDWAAYRQQGAAQSQGMNRMPWTFGAYDQIPQDRDAMMKMFFPVGAHSRRRRSKKRRSKRFCRPLMFGNGAEGPGGPGGGGFGFGSHDSGSGGAGLATAGTGTGGLY